MPLRAVHLLLLMAVAASGAWTGCSPAGTPERPAAARPLILAHRGLTARAPENSVAAVQAALDLGVDGVEVDVHVTADGEAVIFHDEALGRLTLRTEKVRDLALAELVRIPYLDPITRKPSEERITSFASFLDRFGGRCLLFLELKKPEGPRASELRQKLVDRVGGAIVRRKLAASTLVSSLDVATINALEQAHPSVRTVFEFFPPRPRLEALPEVLPEVTPRTDWFGPHHSWITAERVRWARGHYAGVSTFTPNLLEEIVAAARDGADLIQTDAPEMALLWRSGRLDPDSNRGRRVLTEGWPAGDAVPPGGANPDGSIDVALPEAALLTTSIPARPDAINFVSFEVGGQGTGTELKELLFCVFEKAAGADAGTRLGDLRRDPAALARMMAARARHMQRRRVTRGTAARLSATFQAGPGTRSLLVMIAIQGGPHLVRCGKLVAGVVEVE